MTIAAEEDGRSDFGVAEELDELLAFIGHVVPLFEAVVGGNDLDGAYDETKFGGLFEFGLQPSPLGLAEDGDAGAGGLSVDFPLSNFDFLESASEVAGVEHDDLKAFPDGAEDLRMVDAR